MFMHGIKSLYPILIAKREVCIFIHYDVDAICACKILQSLLQIANIRHSLVQISNKKELIEEFHQQTGYKTFVFLNCGGTLDLDHHLEMGDDVNIYIVDSHRPIDILNIYCEKKVHVWLEPEEIRFVPTYDDLYHDEDDEDEDDLSQEQIKELRRWQRARQKIMMEYEEYTFHSHSTALQMFDVAWEASKDSIKMLWWAIVGVSSQLHNKKVGRELYVSAALQLQNHMSRLNHLTSGDDNSRSIGSLKISFIHDLELVLYRHWSLFQSMCHSFPIVSNFKMWRAESGLQKVQELMAEMGISITQCKQGYSFMEANIRESLEKNVEVAAEKFGLKNITLQSFVVQHGFENNISASDMVHAMTSVLNNRRARETQEQSMRANFNEALMMLSSISVTSIEKGVGLAKQELEIINSNLQDVLVAGNQIKCYGPYLLLSIKQGNQHHRKFSEPIFLKKFGHFVCGCYLKTLRRKNVEKGVKLPLIVTAPYDENNEETIIIGLPPASSESKKNLFGVWFAKAVENENFDVCNDYFDSSIIRIRTEHLPRFMPRLFQIGENDTDL